MACDERNRLALEYAKAAGALSKAARRLTGLSGREFAAALAKSATARAECTKARQCLLCHKADHGC